jgi:very-short-patch-repair endonuclease
MKQSRLERTFETIWRQLGGAELETEYRFHEKRRWRFDFAAPGAMVAIELEGGTFSGGRHTRGKGFAADCEKYNAAARLGWRVFRFTADMLRDDPFGNLVPVIGLVKSEP